MSPGKRKSVIEAVDSSSKKRKPAEDPRKQRSDALSDKSIKEVEEFYRRDDISRMCPGKKDCVSVKTSKGREVRKKRLLLYNIAEVHQMFNKRESDTSIGLSKFASLRPPEVIPITLRDQEVCVCKYHENIELLLSEISKAVPGVSKTADEMLCKTVCSTNDAKCMERDCSKCDVEGSVNDMFDECNEDQSVSYYQWETSDDGIVRKVQVNCNLGEAKDDLIVQLQPFGRHVYNIRRKGVISPNDLSSLQGGHAKEEDNFLTNFAVDTYLEMLQTASPNIVVFPWEQFEKSSIIKRQLSAKGKLLEKDLIIAPCCPAGGNHWFLVVAVPKEKTIFALDSLAGSFIEPTAEAAMCKMWHILKKADGSLDIATWRFASNKPGDLPQQANGIDCGVFLLMYARCLATGAPMLCKILTSQQLETR
ncbi:predicted protein [Nematostella vectensis]|uniref:Ubiquitin-like protease family profile domain-containing protein n=1 Tax=Nematostella vectensis TaxID=45351 RepID=A7SCR1_NEMVE|nr:predicted protein [Nematostella vectensis]|eukprot:XP_001630506.1 predicted protein [Nematostella vectensis]